MEEIKKLTRVLKKELHLYERLHKLCEEEEKAIVEGDLKKLEDTVREQERIFLEMRVWEKLRINLIESLKRRFLLPEDAGFSEVVKKTKGKPMSEEIENLRDKIVFRIGQINKLNRRNISLLEYSLKLVDEYFHRLTGTTTTSTYGPKGKNKVEEQTRKLLNKTG